LIRRNGLAVDDLAEPLAKVQALRRVLVFDTCSSGSVVSAAGIFRLAFARLQQAQGVYCLAAAPAGEEAKEPPSLGHGVLTYALLAALGAVDRGPLAQPAGPAPAGVLGWFQFARERVPELYRRPEISGLEQPVEVSGLELPDFPLFGPGPR
jgi:hypothetical protein